MTITHSVQQEFLDDESKSLIYIPCRPNARSVTDARSVTSSAHSSPIRSSGSESSTGGLPTPSSLQMPTPPSSTSPMRTAESTKGERWTEDEHERFLIGMEIFKAGPWKKIAGVVGTRDARQTMSHAQKYRQKIKRRKLGLPTPEYPRHNVDQDARATSATKRMRTDNAANGSEAADRVVREAIPQHVSPSVQLPREALEATTGPAQRATGLDATETMHATTIVTNVGGDAMAGRVDRLNHHQLDAAALEPLDMTVNVSAVVPDSWLGPDELWGFLDGRPFPTPDVAGDQCL